MQLLDTHEILSRNHNQRQPFIEAEQLNLLEQNCCRSYQSLANGIDWWCGKNTIERWLKSHKS
jgi:hypothetical protein